MKRWLLVAVLVVVVVLGIRFLTRTDPAFDLDGFEAHVDQLRRASTLAKSMVETAQPSAYVTLDLQYLHDLSGIMKSQAEDCPEAARAIRERHERFLREKEASPYTLSIEDFQKMNPVQRRETGQKIVAFLGPAFVDLLPVVRDFCDSCPEESEVLTAALGTMARSSTSR